MCKKWKLKSLLLFCILIFIICFVCSADEIESTTETITENVEKSKPKKECKLIICVGNVYRPITSDVVDGWRAELAGDETYNGDSILNFIYTLIDKYNTYDFTTSFTTSDGEVLTFTSPLFQWEIDADKTRDAILSALENDECIVDVVYKNGLEYSFDNSIGDTYVEVSIDKQYVWFYMNGELINQSYCVSGTANGSRDSDKGIYRVFDKMSPAVLRGEDYANSVDYWMPYNGGEGLHDAPWRSEFGGDIYLYAGSHGCINLPHDMAQCIFENISIGCPVIVY